MSAIPATILSVGALSTCSPAADSKGPMSNGRENWAELSTNNSLQPSSSRMAWSLKGRSRNVGMFLAQVTDMYNNCTADSYTFSGLASYIWGMSKFIGLSVFRGDACELPWSAVGLFLPSLESRILVMDIKLCFFDDESGETLLFWPWYWEGDPGGEYEFVSDREGLWVLPRVSLSLSSLASTLAGRGMLWWGSGFLSRTGSQNVWLTIVVEVVVRGRTWAERGARSCCTAAMKANTLNFNTSWIISKPLGSFSCKYDYLDYANILLIFINVRSSNFKHSPKRNCSVKINLRLQLLKIHPIISVQINIQP